MLRVLSTRSKVAEKSSGIVELVGLMGYYDVVAMMLITANAVPPQDADVPQLQSQPLPR